MSIEHSLRGALERHELTLFHQPIIDVAHGTVAGVEALIRWRRGDGTVVPPIDFISIAEETGLIDEIGAWVILEALTQLRSWIDDGVVPPSTTMSVNVSPHQLSDSTSLRWCAKRSTGRACPPTCCGWRSPRA